MNVRSSVNGRGKWIKLSPLESDHLAKSKKGGEELFSFLPFIFSLIYILVIVFVAYFLITAVLFMKKKNRSDELLLQKIDELSQRLGELKEDKRS